MFRPATRSLMAAILLSASIISSWPALCQGIYPDAEKIKETVEDAMSNTKEFVDEEKGFKIAYPASWQFDRIEKGPLSMRFKIFNGLVSGRVAVDDLPGEISLEQYCQATQQQVEATMNAANMPVKVIEVSDGKLANAATRNYAYSYPLAGTNTRAKALQVLAVKGKHGYVFNYTADEKLYDDFLGVMTKIIGTMELL
ncbi:MAG: PsbP-related protein [Candidatus Obscuribacterales bacterium]